MSKIPITVPMSGTQQVSVPWFETISNERPVVYRLYCDGELLYVGCSTSPRKRIRHHARHMEPTPTLCTYVACSAAEMYDIERQWIEELKPRLNKVVGTGRFGPGGGR